VDSERMNALLEDVLQKSRGNKRLRLHGERDQSQWRANHGIIQHKLLTNS